jgi:CspA family cold shock protein
MFGSVKKIVADKGFGFISGTDGREFFFHATAVAGSRFADLKVGTKVMFDAAQGPKGPRAENVLAQG